MEWTTADYRVLLDDDSWLERNGPFDWVFLCRLLDNASNFIIESGNDFGEETPANRRRTEPSWCLTPRRQQQGVSELAVRTVRRPSLSGTLMPQFSLSGYFDAMQAVINKDVSVARPEQWNLPIRRFNPASLTTASGRSIISQLLKAASTIVVDDLDLLPEHLTIHRQQFGLSGTTAIHCRADGFTTESQQYVITRFDWTGELRGVRLW